MIVSLTLHAPLSQWQPLHIHHAASHVTGRVSLLEGGLAELIFDTPLWLADNDRLVLRDISARATLAGARVVTLKAPRRGKRKPDYLHWLSTLADAQDDSAALAIHLERGAVNLPDFGWARQLNPLGMRQLIEQHGFIRAGDNLLSAPVAARWQRKILDTLATYHEQHRDEPGPGRERLRRMALPMEDEALVLMLIERMRDDGLIHSHHGWLHLPDHKAGFSDEQQAVWQKLNRYLAMSPVGTRSGERDRNGRTIDAAGAAAGGTARHHYRDRKDRYYRNDRIVAFANMIRELDQERINLCGGFSRQAECRAETGHSDP